MKCKIMTVLALGILGGCAKSPSNFIPPQRANETVKEPAPIIAATYGYGNDPAVIKAYQQYVKTGRAENIRSEGFKTFAYDAHSRPLAECAPFHLCVVQLEQGESINNIELGDSARWLIGRSLIGTAQQGSWQVAFKPKSYDLATDAVITTNKRTYNIGLVSRLGASTHVMNFYYPEETLSQSSDVVSSAPSTASPVNIAQLNFDYKIQGAHVVWRPSQVFDDGDKTFIKMPEMADRYDLPVLYIYRDKQTQIVNYRYRKPYYVVDGLFQAGILITGKGSHQVRVDILNRHYA